MAEALILLFNVLLLLFSELTLLGKAFVQLFDGLATRMLFIRNISLHLRHTSFKPLEFLQ